MNEVQTYKSFNYILLIVLNATLGGLSLGYKMGEMNRAQINMKYLYEWSSSEENFYIGAITSLLLLGFTFGCYISGSYLLNLFGRRFNLILSDFLLIIGNFIMLIHALNGFPQLVGRFICGIAGGINCSVVPTYINEMSPKKIRGELSSYWNTSVLFGIFLSYLLSFGLPDENTLKIDVSSGYWRFIFIFTTILSIFRIMLLLIYFNFEPAPYYLEIKKEKEAQEVIEKIYKPECVESIFQEYQHFFQKSNFSQMTIKELFRSKYRERLFIGIILFGIQTFSGANAVIYYSAILFGGPEVSTIMLNIFFLIIAAIFMIGSFLSGKVVDRYGRKLLLRWGCIICLIQQFSIFILIIISDENNPNFFIGILIKAIVLSFFFTFGMTLSPVCWIFIAEVVNDKGVSICGISAWGCNFALGFLFPFAVSCSFIKIQGTFLFFSIWLLFGYFFINKYVKETFGKTSEEIDELYRNDGDSLLKNGEVNRNEKEHSKTNITELINL